MRIRPILLASAVAVLTATLVRIAVPAYAHPGHVPSYLPGYRPSITSEETYGTDHFLIHYTRRGNDAVPDEDANVNDTPDYVESLGAAAEFAWSVEIDQFGWTAPPTDRGEGGDDRLDIYLQELLGQGFAGYTDSESGFVGDNPNSPEIERRAAFSYLALDNDYAGLEGSEHKETPEQLMKVTIAHEFNHMIQSGYDAFESQTWIYEATATWIEDEVYPDVNDGVYYLDNTFSQPDLCIVAENNWYGDWLFMRMIAEKYGRDAVRHIWEELRTRHGFDAIDHALADYNTSLDEEFRSYGVALLLRGFEEGTLYPAVHVEGTAVEGEFIPNNGIQSLGTDFVRISGNGLVDITLNDDSSVLLMRAIGVRGRDADVIDALGLTLTLDLSQYDRVFVVIQNPDRTSDEADCTDIDYSLTLATSTSAASPVAFTSSAANFGPNSAQAPLTGEDTYKPPIGQPFTGAGEGQTSETPGGLDVPFTPIVPQAPPNDYTFDNAYVMREQDFGDSGPFYIPGGGKSANYDYLNNNNNWLSITESPSPYTSLADWVADVGYNSQGDYVDVAGTTVLIEDLTDQASPWFSATFITQGLFIVVDGDHDRESVLAMVEALINGGPVPTEEPTPIPTPTLPPTLIPPDVITPQTPIGAAPPIGGADSMIAGLSALTIVLCCAGLCIVALIVGGAVFFIMRGRRQEPRL